MQDQSRERRTSVHLWYLGNALLDFSVSCGIDVLHKYKLLVDDNCEYTRDQEGLFEDLLKRPSVTVTPGGSAQNSARISCRLIQDPDSTVVFVGCLGRDSCGEILKSKVEQEGVTTCYDYCSEEPTGTSACLVTEGDLRTLCARLGAATKFQRSFLHTTKTLALMKKADLLYVEGYFLSHSASCVLDLAEFALINQKVFAFNVSAVYIAEKFFPEISKLLPKVDILFGNCREVIQLACQLDRSVCDISKAVKVLAEYLKDNRNMSRIVVATDGPNPTVCCEGGSNVSHHPIEPVENIADTIGAGDAFVGAFLPVWFRKRKLSDAVSCGIEAARLVIQSKGCVLPKSIPPSILNFL